jgi:DNA-binding response OmpR family regulator
MPKLSGWDVAAKIRKKPEWSSIPFVFLTAKTDSFSKTFGGIVSDDYITKPIDMKTLKQRIDSILDS